MKIATWNVNSLRVRLPHVLQWLETAQPDVLALQEIKIENAQFPIDAFAAVGYQAVFNGQKTYNGVATLSRYGLHAVGYDLPNFEDVQKRVLAATAHDIRIINIYVPNGESLASPKYEYKLQWLRALHDYIAEQRQRYLRLLVLGDFNIAPADEDVHDPAAWQGHVLVSDAERNAWRDLLLLGLHDSFRLFEQPPRSFSWWDYRMLGFRRNHGLRIDHILMSDALKNQCIACQIDKTPRGWEQPSDHTPVWAEFYG